MKMKWACVLILLGVFAMYAFAEETAAAKQAAVSVDEDDDDDDDDNDDDYDYALEKGPGKKKHKYKLLLKGGLYSLITFIAVKVKIILIVLAVIAIIGITLKVFGALKYAGYISGECPTVIHEPAYGIGYSATPPPDHSDYESSYGPSWSSTGSYARSLVNNYIDTDFVYRILNKMDMAEMMFSALEIESDQCRRRIVCEVDAKTRMIPYFEYAMQMFSQGFDKYRTDKNVKFNECATLYPECKEYTEKSARRRKRAAKNSSRHLPL